MEAAWLSYPHHTGSVSNAAAKSAPACNFIQMLLQTFGRERVCIGADRLRPSWRHEMMSRLHIALFAMLGTLGTGQSAAAPVTPPNAELPAIDAAAPAKIETATFALG
jgi:hypothetical protein